MASMDKPCDTHDWFLAIDFGSTPWVGVWYCRKCRKMEKFNSGEIE